MTKLEIIEGNEPGTKYIPHPDGSVYRGDLLHFNLAGLVELKPGAARTVDNGVTWEELTTSQDRCFDMAGENFYTEYNNGTLE